MTGTPARKLPGGQTSGLPPDALCDHLLVAVANGDLRHVIDSAGRNAEADRAAEEAARGVGAVQASQSLPLLEESEQALGEVLHEVSLFSVTLATKREVLLLRVELTGTGHDVNVAACRHSVATPLHALGGCLNEAVVECTEALRVRACKAPRGWRSGRGGQRRAPLAPAVRSLGRMSDRALCKASLSGRSRVATDAVRCAGKAPHRAADKARIAAELL